MRNSYYAKCEQCGWSLKLPYMKGIVHNRAFIHATATGHKVVVTDNYKVDYAKKKNRIKVTEI